MTTGLSTGSEWRKWDLHVHTPGTRLEDRYEKDQEGNLDWERFCRIIHDSGVSAVGITDYFSLDKFFEFKEHYSNYYPEESSRVFFPNLEMRLGYPIHESGKEVNIHAIFPPDLSEEDAQTFMRNLKLKNEDGLSTRKLSCYDIRTWDSQKLKRVSVDLECLIQAIKESFTAANLGGIEESCLLLISGRKDGLSKGRETSGRKDVLYDQIDSRIHGIFGRGKDAEYWLSSTRYSESITSPPKPTFGGCDAHDFEGLEKMLGTSGDDGRRWELTWIKADLTWNGLLQTLAEPEHRVAISELKPDAKADYRVIKAVEFEDNLSFPTRIEFNSNLNAIIGSRSSGKSSLLAHIAYAIDPADTQRQQEAAGVHPGPAAGREWRKVPSSYCRVIWDGEGDQGKIVYIPQNFLSKLSDDPFQVTRYIIPSIRAINPILHGQYQSLRTRIIEINNSIESLVAQWFDAVAKRDSLAGQLASHGAEKAIEAQIEQLDRQITELREQSNITEKDAETYRRVKDRIASLEQDMAASGIEKAWLDGLTDSEVDSGKPFLKASALDISISFNSNSVEIPSSLQDSIEEFRVEAQGEIRHKFISLAAKLLDDSQKASATSSEERNRLQGEHTDLFKRFKANTSIAKIEESRKIQKASLDQRRDLESKKRIEDETIKGLVAKIVTELEERESAENVFVERFNRNVAGYGGLDFGVEVEYVDESLFDLMSKFDRSVSNDYISGRSGDAKFDVSKIQGDVGSFLTQLESGSLKIKRAENPKSVAQSVLTENRDLRFSASLDGDMIGGFKTSTMTPGKQSLFALTLILSDAGEDWPLLIDQPEDDLDSRSIYFEIVEFLKKQKQRRQILMVTHNANLVVGADAECVIVANRHGDDRRNVDNRTFDYFSGSLENSTSASGAEFELERQGIREHVVELLDGGSEAFKKRKDKYKL